MINNINTSISNINGINSLCPLKAQISQGVEENLKHELLKADRTHPGVESYRAEACSLLRVLPQRANPRANIMDFRGFYSSIIVIIRG